MFSGALDTLYWEFGFVGRTERDRFENMLTSVEQPVLCQVVSPFTAILF